MNSTLSIGGAAEVIGAVAMSSTLSVLGDANMAADLSVNGDVNALGSVSTDSTLSVTGSSTLGAGLSVKGDAQVDGTANIEGVASLGSTLSVAGASVLSSSLSVNGTGTVDGAMTLKSTLSVADDVVMSSNVYITGPEFRVPKGDLAGRPAETLSHGLIYFNEDHKSFQGLAKINNTGNAEEDNQWLPLGGVLDHDQDTFIVAMDADFNDTDTLSFHADDKTKPRLTIDASNLEYNANHALASGKVNLNATLDVKGDANFEAAMKVKGTLSVLDSATVNGSVTAFGAADLRNTLSVKLDAAYEKDIRQANNTGIFQVAQHNDTTTYESKFNAASNVGAIVYDRDLQVHMGLQGANTNRGWRPLNGVRDVDGDTIITAESAPGADEDTLTFKAADTIVATMESDKFKIDQALSVGAVTNIEEDLTVNANSVMDGTLSVSGASRVNGELTTNNNVTLNGTSANTLTVKGASTFEQNVTVSSGKTLYAETFLTDTMGHYSDWNGGGEGRAAGQLDMFYENVTIHGDLDIMGQINQSATNITELYVEDKSIVLGASSSSEVRSNSDGTISYTGSNYTTLETSVHESGLKISGVPGYLPEAQRAGNADNALFEKSLLWNLPGDNNTNGTSNLALYSKNDSLKHLEPFWEFKGGQVRITAHTQDDQKEYVSFAFRINSKEQLELVKLVSTNANPIDGETSFKTIAKFGNVVVA